MTEEIFRPIARRIFLKKSRILIHPIAEPAYRVWHEFYIKKSQFNLNVMSGYYQVTPKLILAKLKDEYLFFEDFEYLYNLALEDNIKTIYSVIIPRSKADIELCAWTEVLKLPFQKKINHAEFFETIKFNAPLSVIQKLMYIKRFDQTQYRKFYGISQGTFDTHQKKLKKQTEERRKLPAMADWIRH